MAESVSRKLSPIYPLETIQLMSIGISDELIEGAASSPLIRKKEKSHSIRVRSDTFTYLKEKKKILKDEWGKCTYDMAIRSLLMEMDELKKENEKLLEEKQSSSENIEYYKTLVLNLSKNQKQEEKQERKSDLSLPPPPPSFKKKNIAPLVETENIKMDHKKELLQIFDGGIISPSEVLKRANPLHSQSELTEITVIPNLNKISTAKKYGKRKKTL